MLLLGGPDPFLQLVVSAADEVGDHALGTVVLAHPACAAHTMDVVGRVLRKVKLDNVVHMHGVQASGCHV
jgi:hypothetical protein